MPKIMTKMNAIVKEYVRHVIIASIIIILVSVNYYYITYNWLNVHENPTASPSTTAVIVVAYMRSGSSLTGDILQQSPGAFYVYEPLHYTKFTLQQLWEIFVNGTIRNETSEFLEERLDVIRDWLNCEIPRMKAERLLDHFMKYGKKTSVMSSCYEKEMNANGSYSAAMKWCIKELQTVCETSPMKIIKTIRLPLWAMHSLLQEFPGLKIVHLIRDPRAILTSQNKFGMCAEKRGGSDGCASLLCKRIEKDVTDGEIIARRYPGRMTRLFYESIAERPIETAKKLFDFMGTTFTIHAEEYILGITSANNPDNCAICTTRSNSSEHIDGWKTKIKPDFLKIIEQNCRIVLDHFHYS